MAPSNDSEQALQILDQAIQVLRRGDRTRARHLALLAARLDPANERSWLIVAATASPKASVFYLNKALELNPGSEAAHKGLQWAADRLERLGSAPVVQAEISAQAESSGEITRPVAVRSKPQYLAQRILNKARQGLSGSRLLGTSTIKRVANYTVVRVATLGLTIIASLFLIIYIANLGGYLDTIQKGLIGETITGMLMGGWLKDKPPEERPAIIEQTRWEMEEFYGLHQPYALRSLNWLSRGLTFDWGQARFVYVISTNYWEGTRLSEVLSRDIHTIVITYLPRTLLLIGSSNLVLFLISILIGLPFSRRPNAAVDRVLRLLSLTASVPSWVFGLILLGLLGFVFGIRSFSLGFSAWPTTFRLEYIPIILQGLLLPFLAIFLSKFFQSVYAWRTYFLVYSKEDYIELARAKGLPDSVLERRYLLRPALPAIITSFSLIVVSMWQECIAVEYFFDVGGIGALFVQALNNNDLMIVVALVATFAFFLAITVLLLDVVYAIVDPRVRIGDEKQSGKPLRNKTVLKFPGFFRRKKQAAVFPQLSSRMLVDPPENEKKRLNFFEQLKLIWERIANWAHSLTGTIREIMRYPAAIFGMVIILILTGIAAYTILAIPYDKAISFWRGDDKYWIRNPREVPPAWTNLFRAEKLPLTIKLNSQDKSISKVVAPVSDETSSVSFSLPFEYTYSAYPQDILVLFNAKYKEKKPFVSMTWVTPDGREIKLKNFSVSRDSYNLFSVDSEIIRKLSGNVPAEALFVKPGVESGEVLKGKYALKINGFVFEEGSQLDAELVVYGHVFGVAGTDSFRRDLSLILAWGLVVALAFGIIAAIGTSISSVVIAATGAWFGGWVDGLIQRITEIMMVLPILPTSIMIFFLYSKSIWIILGVTIGLSIFGNSIKNYRAMFLQLTESPYIEAARSYGASNWRIIFQYMIPRIRSILIPQVITLIPGYVFFEATLAFLGVSDPLTPTLGNLLVTTMKNGIFVKPAYLTLEPFAMLLLITLGFAFFGFALEHYFNEKLGV